MPAGFFNFNNIHISHIVIICSIIWADDIRPYNVTICNYSEKNKIKIFCVRYIK